MPNAINRYKTDPLNKIEAEIESNDIHRKPKPMDKVMSPKVKSPKTTTTILNRLNKVKKNSSKETINLNSNRCQTNTKSFHSNLGRVVVTQRILKKSPQMVFLGTNLNNSINKPSKKLKADKKDKFPNSELKPIKKLLSQHNLCNCKPSIENLKFSTNTSYLVKSIATEPTTQLSSAQVSSSDESQYLSQSSKYNMSIDINNQQSKSLLTDRSIYSSNGCLSCESTACSNCVSHVQSTCISENLSLDDYHMAPLIPVPTRTSLNTSINISDNLKTLLGQKNHTMNPEEISLIKNVMKTDNRHHQLDKNDSKLFKTILKTQLEEIVRQEIVVKNALKKLEAYPSYKSKNTNFVGNSSKLSDNYSIDSVKPQVDIIFKNVPTLEKEIIILKALGAKLEATLQRTVTEAPSVIDISKSIGLREVTHTVTGIEHNAIIFHYSFGHRYEIGFIKEFRIAKKTIIELKEQANRHFYLPTGDEIIELKRTCFEKLKKTPDEFMRHLKPKNSFVPFNVLDQDPIFFNSFLQDNNQSKNQKSLFSEDENRLETDISEESVQKIPKKIESNAMHNIITLNRDCSNNDPNNAQYEMIEKSEQMIEKVEKKIEEVAEKVERVEKMVANIEKSENCVVEAHKKQFEASFIYNKKRRFTYQPPQSIRKELLRGPKSNIMRTLIVGSVQLIIFLILIMAFTFPDVRCF